MPRSRELLDQVQDAIRLLDQAYGIENAYVF